VTGERIASPAGAAGAVRAADAAGAAGAGWAATGGAAVSGAAAGGAAAGGAADVMLADLGHHGDADLVPGLVDLAVNVRSSGTPAWLAARIRETDLAAYPDQRPAVAAVAARHRRATEEVLLTAGAAEAFVLLARALRPRHAVVVHPQFTEPEAALRAAGHQVDRVILPFPFTLDPALIPADADLVFIGNPTNPTSVAHPREALLRLVRPGRTVVVDEAFADCLPGEPQSAAATADLDGLVVIRSLTKTWALAGLRVGYLLGAPPLVRLLAAAQPPWPVSAPALTACVATATDAAAREVEAWARGLADARSALLAGLACIDGVRVVPGASASFALLDTGIADIRTRLHARGFAVRRGETFPGLRPGWIRVAVRDPETSDRFSAALGEVITDG
jgi:histidinol-phosphate aminotransferase